MKTFTQDICGLKSAVTFSPSTTTSGYLNMMITIHVPEGRTVSVINSDNMLVDYVINRHHVTPKRKIDVTKPCRDIILSGAGICRVGKSFCEEARDRASKIMLNVGIDFDAQQDLVSRLLSEALS